MISIEHPHLSAEETARLGDEIYERQIRLRVEAENRGKIAAIDVETGAYASAETALAASRLLQSQHPSTEVWFVRIGHRALHKIGARSLGGTQVITGTVNTDREGVIRLRVLGANGQEQEIDGVIDTGFNGFLTLPPTLIAALAYSRIGYGRTQMSNGKEEAFDIYEATVVWDGHLLTIEADEADTDALIGMSLIWGYELRV